MPAQATFAAIGALLLGAVCALAGEPVVFHGQIDRILHAHCSGCHRTGGAAPFALLTYRDAAEQAERIGKVVARGEMPPWKAVGDHGEFVGDLRLSEVQKRLIDQWIKDGCPEGDRSQFAFPPAPPPAWQLGEPDVVIRPAPLGARGPAGMYAAELEAGDAWITAIEIRPRQAGFQHALLWLDLPVTSQVIEIDDAGQSSRRGSLLPAWLRDRILAPAPSAFRPAERAAAIAARDRRLVGVWAFDCLAQSAPSGSALRFPGGSRLIVEMPAAAEGGPPPLEVGLHLATEPPEQLAAVVAVEALAPRGGLARDVARHGSFQVPVDCELHGLAPHADAACGEVRVGVTLPDGRSESLLWIDRWDPRWETTYQYRRPLQLPARSRIDVQLTTATQGPLSGGGPALVAAQLVPIRLADYDELVRTLQRTQMNVAREPVKAARIYR